jgi:hypothetical protein
MFSMFSEFDRRVVRVVFDEIVSSDKSVAEQRFGTVPTILRFFMMDDSYSDTGHSHRTQML